jgi:hypothetical protein
METQSAGNLPLDSSEHAAYKDAIDAASHEEKSNADHSLDSLRSDLESGNVTSETQLTVHIDYCTDNSKQALSVRHNPARYR